MSNQLPYVIRQPKKPTKTPSLLILLHGYGSNELDLFSFSDELPDDLLIVSLRAPYEIGHGGYAWYAIDLDSENNKFSDLVQARESMHKIAATIDDLKTQISDKNIDISITLRAKKELASRGYDKTMGARPLNRVIAKEIKDKITDEILFGKLKKGGLVKIDFVDDEFKFDYKKI